MTERCEDYILNMKTHLFKLHKHKINADAMHNRVLEGRIELPHSVKSHVISLGEVLR